MVRIAVDEAGWCSVDEIGFGPRRAARPPSPRLRGFAAAVSIAGAVAAAIAIAMTAAGTQRPATSPTPGSQSAAQAAAVPAPVLRPPSAVCAPTRPAWPSLADLPAGLHAGAVPIVVDEQFSGQCPASAP
jgi:hypothetical protein